MTEPPVLSNVTYDELVVDDRMGPYAERVTRAEAGRLAGAIGEDAEVSTAPPAVFPVLFLKGLRRAMGGIPPGSVLAKQELEFHSELALDAEVAITVWVGDKQVRRERPFVTIEFDIAGPDGARVVTGRKVIVWPTGPGQEAAA